MQNQPVDESKTTTNPTKETLKPLPALATDSTRPIELGGPTGPEPTRFGDWEKGGRCTDF